MRAWGLVSGILDIMFGAELVMLMSDLQGQGLLYGCCILDLFMHRIFLGR